MRRSSAGGSLSNGPGFAGSVGGRTAASGSASGRSLSLTFGGRMRSAQLLALGEAVAEERLVRRVLQQPAHQVGHARHQLADRGVDPQPLPHRPQRGVHRLGHAVEHLQLDGAVGQPGGPGGGQPVGQAAEVVAGERRADRPGVARSGGGRSARSWRRSRPSPRRPAPASPRPWPPPSRSPSRRPSPGGSAGGPAAPPSTRRPGRAGRRRSPCGRPAPRSPAAGPPGNSSPSARTSSKVRSFTSSCSVSMWMVAGTSRARSSSGRSRDAGLVQPLGPGQRAEAGRQGRGLDRDVDPGQRAPRIRLQQRLRRATPRWPWPAARAPRRPGGRSGRPRPA